MVRYGTTEMTATIITSVVKLQAENHSDQLNPTGLSVCKWETWDLADLPYAVF